MQSAPLVKKRLMIMAAGTGGHIFPGLAIAKTMQERGWSVTWLGTKQGMEQTLVPKEGIEIDSLDFAGIRGKGLMHAIAGTAKMMSSVAQCGNIISDRKPDLVLGLGGYVTVPGGVVACSRGIPLVLVNADASLLLSNKLLAPFSNRVLFGFPGNYGSAAKKAKVTGNPVRQQILDIAPPEVRCANRTGRLRILVVGGSLGAQSINKALPAALSLMPVHARPFVIHQSGAKNADSLRAAYEQAGVEAEVVDFIDDIAIEYAKADLVICRAGAITLAELTAAGVASLLVPLVISTTSHQRYNARWMAGQGAALQLPNEDFNVASLHNFLTSLTRQTCVALAIAARKVGNRDSNEAIAQELESIVDQYRTTKQGQYRST
jgi:UDP-N-acetylglucosamine--N-acetylmuramyl-(pentapeptide) pyrophosphoryl-undecaprenol N-acetylglucosamine transferase